MPLVRLRLALLPFLAVLSLSLLCSPAAFSQTAPSPPAKAKDDKTPLTLTFVKEKPPQDYSQEPYIFNRLDSTLTFEADGTGTIVQTAVIKYQTDSAVHEAGVIPFPYASREQSLNIDYMRVRKPDGRVIETPAADIQDLPTQITQQAPLYSDYRVKQVPIKGLSAGDTVEYQFHLKTEHPAAPGNFWNVLDFMQEAVVLEQTSELRVPKDKYVKVVSKDVQPIVTEDGGQKVYTWHTSHLDPAPRGDKKKKKLAADQQPDVQFTTFHDWAEVGAWYDALQKDRVEVTPEISAKAQDLTKGLTSDDDKIRAIYTYVSTQFRYIGVDFGVGRFQPHHATEVLDNQYGDCKDKHTLLASLLKAAGYAAWPALIKPDGKLRLDVPMPIQFNHVITAVQLNGKTLWLDSTAETSPYGLLLAGLRDQQALLIPDNAPAHLVTTPADPPYQMFDRWTSTGTLTKEGEYTGKFVITMRDDSEVAFRAAYRNTPRADWDKFTKNWMAYFRFGGAVTDVDTSSPNDLAQAFKITFDYERKEFGDWENLRIYPMLPIWAFLFGKDDDPPVDSIQIGDFGENVYRSEMTLPTGYKAELPQATKIHTDFVDYSNTYSLAKGVLIVERKFNVSKIKIPSSSWKEYLRWQKAVGDDEDRMVQILRPGEEADADTADNPQAREFMKQAYETDQRGDNQATLALLESAKKINPKQPGLYAFFGYVFAKQGQMDKALAAYEQDLQAHPQNVKYTLQIVEYFETLHKTDDAIVLAREVVKGAPDDVPAQMTLSRLLLYNGHAAEAVTVIEKAATAPGATPALKLQLARAYLKASRPSDAEPLLKSVIQTSDDPFILNDASYELIDLGLDLPMATDAAQKSLKLQEAALSTVTLEHVTNDNLDAVEELVAVWDTVGWAYFKAGETDKALSYAQAAWAVRQDATASVHLGQILEKQGNIKQAQYQNRLALILGSGKESDDTTLARKRLDGADPAPPPPDALLNMRTIKLPKQKGQSGSAQFSVLFGPSGTEDVKFISGNQTLRPMADELRKAKFNAPFPTGSPAKIIRLGILDCSVFEKDCTFLLIETNVARAQ